MRLILDKSESFQSTGCFFNSDTFQIHIIKPFLEILKSTKVKSTPYSLTFVNTIKNPR